MGNSHRASWTILWLQVSTLSSLGNAFVTVFTAAAERAGCEVHKLLCTGEVPHHLNPFTAPACNISGLKDARTRLQTVYFPVLSHICFERCVFR